MALKVLSYLDTARTQYYHFKAIIIAGMGLFTDAYDLFCITPIMRLISHIYHVPHAVTTTMVVVALLGTVIGQLVSGRFGDMYGRRRVYGVALVLMVMGSVGCGFSICTSPACVLASLGFFRFVLGVGIGGDYPLSATIMSEFANKRTRGAFIAAVFSMQGMGILVGSTVTMAVCKIFEAASQGKNLPNNISQAASQVKPLPNNITPPGEADLAWRLILMMGAIPAGMTFYWRMMMPETARYTALVENNALQAAKNMEKVLEVPLAQISEDVPEFPPNHPPPLSYPFFSREFFRRHGRDLFSCSASWFLVDIVFYSTNLVQSLIYDNFLEKYDKVNAYQDAFQVARLQAIIAVCSTIPGYYATVYFIDRIGRVKIQFMGFFFMALSLFATGIPYDAYWHKHRNVGFLCLYGVTLFFSNFGPNTTTFIVPAELFPARFRSTCHGISGAFGKVGAIMSVGFLWASTDYKTQGHEHINSVRMTAALMILGGVCVLGMVVTYFFTRETMGRSLEENESEEDDTRGLCFLRCFTDSCLRRRQPYSAGEVSPAA